jgi:hypothetical protein
VKHTDINLGKVYYTYIGKHLCPIVVTGILSIDGKTPVYRVRREGEENNLPMPRTAGSLRKEPIKQDINRTS